MTQLNVEESVVVTPVKQQAPQKTHVVHTEHEITVQHESPQDVAELRAQAVFETLRDDWNEEAMSALTSEIGKIALSKERVKVVLQHTQDKRVTCVQLNELLKTVALEAHKEQILFE